MAVSRRLRFEILRRDNYTCRYCGAKSPDVTLTVDHVLAVALGGGDEPNNLVTACADCNSGKASTTPDAPIVEDVDAAALLFAQALERAADQRRGELGELDGAVGRWLMTWEEFGDPWLPGDWAESIERFLSLGLDEADLARLALTTLSVSRNNYFRYFCGCCWREISQRQELARRMIEDGEV